MTAVLQEPVGRFSAVHTIGRGLEEAPVLRQGLGVTWLLAAVGAGGRVVVPILLQQAIDKGTRDDDGDTYGVRVRFVVACAVIAVGRWRSRESPAGRRHPARHPERAGALRPAPPPRRPHPPHEPRRPQRGTARRARGPVTSDIETLAEFFQWGGLAWLLNGPLMLLVASVMLAYDWLLASSRSALGPARLRAADRAAPARRRLRTGSRAQRRDALRDHRGRGGRRDDPRLRRRGVYGDGTRAVGDGPTPRSAGNSSAPSVPARARCSRRRHGGRDRHRRGGDPARRRTHDRGDGRLHVPHLPLPRADRGVHRGARPDPDRGRRPATSARRARRAGRPAADRTRPGCRRTASRSRSATSRSPTRPVATTSLDEVVLGTSP